MKEYAESTAPLLGAGGVNKKPLHYCRGFCGKMSSAVNTATSFAEPLGKNGRSCVNAYAFTHQDKLYIRDLKMSSSSN